MNMNTQPRACYSCHTNYGANIYICPKCKAKTVT